MKDGFLGLAMIAGAILGIMALSYFGLQWAGFLGKEREQIRRDIFENSQAFVHGKRNDLNRMCLEFDKADGAGRTGIANAIRDQFAAVDTSDYPTHLQSCLVAAGAR